MGMDNTPEPLEDVLPLSPAPADEEHPPGSSVEEDGGGANDEVASLDIDDDLDEAEESLSLDIPAGYSPESLVPAAISAALVKRWIGVRLGIEWL